MHIFYFPFGFISLDYFRKMNSGKKFSLPTYMCIIAEKRVMFFFFLIALHCSKHNLQMYLYTVDNGKKIIGRNNKTKKQRMKEQ